jgi:hypothetical protein
MLVLSGCAYRGGSRKAHAEASEGHAEASEASEGHAEASEASEGHCVLWVAGGYPQEHP